MKIRDFGVEIWMNLYENNCTYNLAETCVKSFELDEFLNLVGNKQDHLDHLLKMKMSYGDIEGSDDLIAGIQSLYKQVNKHQVTVTHGAIGANALAMFALVEPGDEVISVLPTYQQHYSIPEAYGANVKILKLKEENNFLPDLEELRDMMSDKVKLICINNPNNPTGALMDEDFLKQIADIAKVNKAYVLCDEVYRGLAHDQTLTASIVDIYDKGISSSSMSKTFSLAGLRIGWLVGPQDFIEAVNRRRDYNTISCGRIDDYLAAVALKNKDLILDRNHKILSHNKHILMEWVKQETLFSLVEPKAGTTAFVRYHVDMPSEDFCVDLLNKTGVMVVPGKALDVEGYIRIGYAYDPQALKIGLDMLSEYIRGL